MKHALHIGAVDGVEVGLGGRRQISKERDTGAVDQDVDPAATDDLGKTALHAVSIRDIARDGSGQASAIDDRFGRSGGELGIDVQNVNRGSAGSKPDGDRFANPTRTPGDHDVLAVERQLRRIVIVFGQRQPREQARQPLARGEARVQY